MWCILTSFEFLSLYYPSQVHGQFSHLPKLFNHSSAGLVTDLDRGNKLGVCVLEQQEGIGISSSSIVLDSLITFILLVFPPAPTNSLLPVYKTIDLMSLSFSPIVDFIAVYKFPAAIPSKLFGFWLLADLNEIRKSSHECSSAGFSSLRFPTCWSTICP